jgi:hypothetical protein
VIQLKTMDSHQIIIVVPTLAKNNNLLRSFGKN